MRSDREVYQRLTDVCPGTYVAYKPGKAPPLPWFCYQRAPYEEYYADNSNYTLFPRYRVELYMKDHDDQLVEDFERALSELGTYRLYNADYLDSESCILHDYRLQFLPNLDKEVSQDGQH